MKSGFVALVGRPNVGKSTLLNRLVGRRLSIVSDKPQTTRHRIAGVLHLPHAQAVFLDTPGFQRPRDELGAYMQRVVRAALDGIDAVAFVVDATSRPGPGDRRIAQDLSRLDVPVLVVVNKVDAAPRPDGYTELLPGAPCHPVSALRGDGVDSLREALVARLPEGPAYFPADRVTDRPEEFLMGELIREQVFALTRDEVPHATTVEVERIEARPGGVLRVEAIVYVERESQKGIVIGQGGRMLRDIGTRARHEIEGVLGSPVYLELRVKVKDAWRRRPGSLQTLGYRLD